MRYSVAMTGEVNTELRRHLLRPDGQEDVIVATYRLSTGTNRTTAILRTVIPPRDGDRHVHGTASFTGGYILRAAAEAKARGEGLVLLHSHPGGRDWQGLSHPDHDTESDYERVARGFTGMPMVGMTLAGGDGAWSARFWHERHAPTWAESVRVVCDRFAITWNDDLRPIPVVTDTQLRTVSSWGSKTQASVSRMRGLVVGVGSVGLDVAQRLAATGLLDVGVMDFDAVEPVNLDRMIGATRLDAALRRSKADVAVRLMQSAATSEEFIPVRHEASVTDPAGLDIALDYDVIFSCVDRPWPRAVLNLLAYTDLIPVIDGGIALDTFPDGRLRSGIWRAHTLLPGRPCMMCLGQLDAGELALDRQGLLDDPAYIQQSGRKQPARQNVATLSASVSAALLTQFVSLTAHPGGLGVPAGLRYLLGPHQLEHSAAVTGPYCTYEVDIGVGDGRAVMTERQDGWRQIVERRPAHQVPWRLRLLAAGERELHRRIAGLV